MIDDTVERAATIAREIEHVAARIPAECATTRRDLDHIARAAWQLARILDGATDDEQ